MSIDRTTQYGFYAGLASYCFWGFAPIYFKLLAQLPALDVIAHRVLWAVILLALFLLARDGRALLRKLRLAPRRVAVLAISGSLVAGNWLIFVWAVNHGQVLATALGYFIAPLVSVFLGLLFLRERLFGAQWLALAIATTATLYLSVFIGEPPWIALALAGLFGFYGLLRKTLAVGPMIGMMWETTLLLPAALVYLLCYAPSSTTTLPAVTWWLLIGSGLVTLLPLIGFNYAAKRLTLSTIGFLQYLAPSISFMLAVFLYREPFGPNEFIAFAGIWLALAIFTLASLRRQRQTRRLRDAATIGSGLASN